MSEEAVRAFDSRRENAFDLRHVCTCHSLKELAALPSPKLIIATSADLTTGLAAEILPIILAVRTLDPTQGWPDGRR